MAPDSGRRARARRPTGGVWFVSLGSTGSATQILTTPNSAHFIHVIGGQLYASASDGAFTNVFTVGTGLPTTAGQTATSLPGMPTDTASPYSFVFFDRDVDVPGLDTLYVADDGDSSVHGVQKWTLAQGDTDWTQVDTFSTCADTRSASGGSRAW